MLAEIKKRLKQLHRHVNYQRKIVLNGRRYLVPITNNSGLLNLSISENWFTRLITSLKIPAETSFLDIGVNVGQTILMFKSCYSNPYWGFEPNPVCVAYLTQLIAVNKLKNTTIIPVGLSSENGLVRLFQKHEVDSAATMVSDLRPEFYDASETSFAPVFAFDQLNIAEIGKISLIKIDVEGAELEVLTGLKKTLGREKPYVICEILDFHSEKGQENSQKRADQVLELMKSLHYTCYRILHSKTTLSFDRVEQVQLKMWTDASWSLNDYLFVPEGLPVPPTRS